MGTENNTFELILWADDQAPDAETGYFLWKRVTGLSFADAKDRANEYVDRGVAVGAGVYDDADHKLVFAVGITDTYPSRDHWSTLTELEKQYFEALKVVDGISAQILELENQEDAAQKICDDLMAKIVSARKLSNG